MKKVKLKISSGEINIVNEYLTDTIGQRPKGLSDTHKLTWRIVEELMMKLNFKLLSKQNFELDKKTTIRLNVQTACAFILYFGWRPEPDDSPYLVNTVIRIQNEIKEQLNNGKFQL